MSFANRLAPYGTTIFTEINRLVLEHDAVNLGQGRPDFDGPQSMLQAAADAMLSGQANQYPPGTGIGRLRHALCDHAQTHYGLDIDPRQGVIVTVGATEGVYTAITSLVNPGDEVILIEPYYDTYRPAVTWAGGVPVYVPMQPPTWRFDPDTLRAAFSEKTRAIVINTPHNPTGRVFDRDELALIAELCQQHDVIAICDEVYEHLLFDDAGHIPLMTLPGMFERTLRVSSAAKTFSVTGWKVGWVMGHPDLMEGVWRVHQNITFAVNAPAQYGVTHALSLGQPYIDDYQAMYTRKRELLLDGLRAAGIKAEAPQGAFYIMGDFSDVFDGDDVAFTKYLIQEIGVGCIPPSAFFSPEHKTITHDYVRFCFAKNDDTLYAAVERLAKLQTS